MCVLCGVASVWDLVVQSCAQQESMHRHMGEGVPSNLLSTNTLMSRAVLWVVRAVGDAFSLWFLSCRSVLQPCLLLWLCLVVATKHQAFTVCSLLRHRTHAAYMAYCCVCRVLCDLASCAAECATSKSNIEQHSVGSRAYKALLCLGGGVVCCCLSSCRLLCRMYCCMVCCSAGMTQHCCACRPALEAEQYTPAQATIVGEAGGGSADFQCHNVVAAVAFSPCFLCL